MGLKDWPNPTNCFGSTSKNHDGGKLDVYVDTEASGSIGPSSLRIRAALLP